MISRDIQFGMFLNEREGRGDGMCDSRSSKIYLESTKWRFFFKKQRRISTSVTFNNLNKTFFDFTDIETLSSSASKLYVQYTKIIIANHRKVQFDLTLKIIAQSER